MFDCIKTLPVTPILGGNAYTGTYLGASLLFSTGGQLVFQAGQNFWTELLYNKIFPVADQSKNQDGGGD